MYVYFRYNDNESVMVILNKNDERKELDTAHFAESLPGFTSGRDILSGNEINDLSKIEVPGASAMIIELE
jgi:neopullulanase